MLLSDDQRSTLRLIGTTLMIASVFSLTNLAIAEAKERFLIWRARKRRNAIFSEVSATLDGNAATQPANFGGWVHHASHPYITIDNAMPPANNAEQQLQAMGPPPNIQFWGPLQHELPEALLCHQCGQEINRFHNHRGPATECRQCIWRDKPTCRVCRDSRLAFEATLQLQESLAEKIHAQNSKMVMKVVEEMGRRVDALWYAPGMPGFNCSYASFERVCGQGQVDETCLYE